MEASDCANKYYDVQDTPTTKSYVTPNVSSAKAGVQLWKKIPEAET